MAGGFRVDRVLASALRESAAAVKASSGLCSLFCDGAGEPKAQGALVTHPRLAALLRAVALQDDALPRALALDLPPAEREPFQQAMGDPGLELETPLALQLGETWLYAAPAPTAGRLLARGAPSLRASPVRPASVGSQLAVADSQGNVLLLSASLNSSFGSRFLAPSSGVLLSDLTAPAGPGLLSWACPVVLSLAEEGAVVGLGATGGSAAPLAIAQAIINQVYLGQPLQEALGSPWLQLRAGTDGDPQGCGAGAPSNLSQGEWAEHTRAFATPATCCHRAGY
uniref:Uncharacterized protein n=1 Tax=Pelusios castaneus TaxID=367368 RepID=A0A8C8VH42_9SAUR